ncbi:hypothetical protein [Metamycoplasma buccale]|uniref:TMEM164 family acyltransferase n=1 Tax=Metamycoplasma buccale TaxID=55602 RepID=UPI00398EDCCB
MLEVSHQKGFFSWKGNHLNFTGASTIIFYLFFALTILASFLLWIFRNPIRRNYQNRETIMKMKKNNFWILFGSISLFLLMARSFILLFTKIPRPWESIPLHLCRLMLIFIIITFITNKFSFIKYFVLFAILGAFIAFIIPGLDFRTEKQLNSPSPIGIDNFYYWDYLFAHIYVYALSFVLLIINDNNKYTFKHALITFGMFSAIFIVIFFINFLTNKFASELWKTNYFYLGFNKYNPFYKVGGILTHWPYHLISYIVLSFIILIFMVFVISFQEIFYLDKVENKWIFKIQKSKIWCEYWKSCKVKK